MLRWEARCQLRLEGANACASCHLQGEANIRAASAAADAANSREPSAVPRTLSQRAPGAARSADRPTR